MSEAEKERADNSFHKIKNSLRWILKGNRPKKFKISTIFTYRPEMAQMGKIKSENCLERQNGAADQFFS